MYSVRNRCRIYFTGSIVDNGSGSMTLQSYLSEVRKKAEANIKFCDGFRMPAHDKVELIAQAAAFQMCLKDRCTDLAKLVEALEVAVKAFDDYEPFAVTGAFRKAKLEIERIVKGEK